MIAPSGVVTFLFTDIEGSTRRWESDPEQMRAALETHDVLLREAIEECSGWLFKHTGDGVCAAFSSPTAAVDAAIAAQRALGLPVRMGIATGEAEQRGDDYFGAVLNRAARVMAAGHGGQILIDGATAELLNGVELADLGPRRMRDMTKPVHVFQVRAPDLPTDFPPLRTIDAAPGNLRPRTTSFVGREPELAELQAALKAHRLVTLTGVGGVGKTRLALEVAALSAADFLDGVWVIELAPITDPAAVPDAAAVVLGITQQSGLSVADSVAAALEGRTRLLVFDNCEHVLDAAAEMIEKILARTESVRILATSREGLRVADEQLWPVPSLDLQSSAAKLFVERAHAVSPAVSLTTADGAVVEICRRLDGIPLAIELAASRMQSMAVTELQDRLDDRFRLLVGSRRGLERHQTLRHAVQWSYDLLDDAEKSLLDRCSVFAGGFDLAGACAMASSRDQFAVLDLLDALVRKSLLVADSSTGHTRFSMLETVRQFAEEQLVAMGDAEQARTAHARYFAECEVDLLDLWNGPRQQEAYIWFATELPNLRTAFRWAADHGDLDSAAAVAVYATLLGSWVEQFEAIAWAEELVEPARAVTHRRLAQLYVMAAQCYLIGRIDEAIGYADAGRTAIESGDFEQIPCEFETWVAGVYTTMGQPELWAEICRDIIAREAGPHPLTRACMAVALLLTGDGSEARAASEGLLSADLTGNPRVRCVSLLAYGTARIGTDPKLAHAVLRQGLTVAQESGNRAFESHLALALSRTVTSAVDALDYLALTIGNYYDSGSFSIMPQALGVLASLLERLDYREPAAIISGFAATPLTLTGVPEFNTAVAHLRDVLGDIPYESLAHAGAEMTNGAITIYALEQIDHARAELE